MASSIIFDFPMQTWCPACTSSSPRQKRTIPFSFVFIQLSVIIQRFWNSFYDGNSVFFLVFVVWNTSSSEPLFDSLLSVPVSSSSYTCLLRWRMCFFSAPDDMVTWSSDKRRIAVSNARCSSTVSIVWDCWEPPWKTAPNNKAGKLPTPGSTYVEADHLPAFPPPHQNCLNLPAIGTMRTAVFHPIAKVVSTDLYSAQNLTWTLPQWTMAAVASF